MLTFLAMPFMRSFSMRTISADSLLTMVLVFSSHSTGTVYLPAQQCDHLHQKCQHDTYQLLRQLSIAPAECTGRILVELAVKFHVKTQPFVSPAFSYRSRMYLAPMLGSGIQSSQGKEP